MLAVRWLTITSKLACDQSACNLFVTFLARSHNRSNPKLNPWAMAATSPKKDLKLSSQIRGFYEEYLNMGFFLYNH
jgi:hypothetical protein